MNSYLHIEHWLKKGMSEEEAIEKIKDIKERMNMYKPPFWIRRGYSEEEAKNKISEIQRNNAAKVNHKTKKNTCRLEYWIDKGYDYETAKKKLKDRQTTFTLDKCIKRYGEIEGTRIYQERQEKWQNTLNTNNDIKELNKKRGLTKEKFIEKHGIEEFEKNIDAKRLGSSKEVLINKFGEEKYIERINKIKNGIRKKGFNKYSKISLELFESIQKDINEKCYFGKNERIIQFYDEDGKYFCFYIDFIYGNRIIEFYGDYYHANPKLYKSDKIIGSKYKYYKAEEVWKRDFDRIELIKNRGFEILIVWENDYKKNKENIKNKCIEWIKNL